MLAIDYIRKNADKVKAAAVNKNRVVDVDLVLSLDEQKRDLMHRIQTLRQERNTVAKNKDIQRGKEIKEELKSLEQKEEEIAKQLNELMLQIPNVPLDIVPVGKDEASNVEFKKWGDPKSFSFQPKSHEQLGNDLGILELERGSKVSGFRGYFLKGKLAQLHFGVLMFALQKLIQKGFVPLTAPSVVKEFTLFGSGQFPWGQQDVYKLNDDDAYLAGTGEVAVS